VDTAEGFLVGDIIHKDEAHRTAIVSCCYCPISFLTCRVPNLQLDPLVLSEYSLHFEVDTNSADEGRGEGIVSVPEEEGGLAHRAVPDDEQLEHVVEVLVGCVFLP